MAHVEYKSFQEINDYVKARLTEPRVFHSGKHSFLKVMQHALSYCLNDWTRLLLPNKMHWPFPLLAIYYAITGMRGTKATHKLRQNTILDQGRIYRKSPSKVQSMYFDKIQQVLGTDTTSVIIQQPEHGLKGDYTKNELQNIACWPDAHELNMLREVKTVANQISAYSGFTQKEKGFILSALHVYYTGFRSYYRILKNQEVKNLFFIAHYHNEGLIAACEKLGIEAIEVQHGLIAESDIYYVYDEQFKEAVKDAFFPHHILVYGTYWKEILLRGCEFSPEKIIVAGDYLSTAKPQHKQAYNKQNIVLIGAQKNMEIDYLPYLKHLKENFDFGEWKVVIKLHPLETELKQYQELEGGAFEIAPPNARLDELLEECKIQISIYSTTLYDAIGYEVINLSLQDFGYAKQYAADMVSHRVAFPLFAHEHPIEVYNRYQERLSELRSREEIYAPFTEQAIGSVIQK
jgi:hypothetical protein